MYRTKDVTVIECDVLDIIQVQRKTQSYNFIIILISFLLEFIEYFKFFPCATLTPKKS